MQSCCQGVSLNARGCHVLTQRQVPQQGPACETQLWLLVGFGLSLLACKNHFGDKCYHPCLGGLWSGFLAVERWCIWTIGLLKPLQFANTAVD